MCFFRSAAQEDSKSHWMQMNNRCARSYHVLMDFSLLPRKYVNVCQGVPQLPTCAGATKIVSRCVTRANCLRRTLGGTFNDNRRPTRLRGCSPRLSYKTLVLCRNCYYSRPDSLLWHKTIVLYCKNNCCVKECTRPDLMDYCTMYIYLDYIILPITYTTTRHKKVTG